MKLILSPKDSTCKVILEDVASFCQEGITLLVVFECGTARNYPLEHIWYYETNAIDLTLPLSELLSQSAHKSDAYAGTTGPDIADIPEYSDEPDRYFWKLGQTFEFESKAYVIVSLENLDCDNSQNITAVDFVNPAVTIPDDAPVTYFYSSKTENNKLYKTNLGSLIITGETDET